MVPFKYLCAKSNTWAISVLLTIDCFFIDCGLHFLILCMIIISSSILDIV